LALIQALRERTFKISRVEYRGDGAQYGSDGVAFIGLGLHKTIAITQGRGYTFLLRD